MYAYSDQTHSFQFGNPTEVYSMSDSRTSTVAGMSQYSTPAQVKQWLNKHATIKQAIMM